MTITCFKSRHFSTFPVFFQRISARSKKYKLFSYPPATDYFVFANFAGTQTSRQAAFILQFRGTWFCTSVTKPSLSKKHL